MKNIEDSAGFPDELLARRIEYLSGFMTAERYATLCRAVDMRTRYMTVCMENTFHPQNASALVRNCEAFGVQELHAVESCAVFRRTCRSCAAPTNGSKSASIRRRRS